MRKIQIKESKELNELTYSTTLENGLQVYICKKKGYNKKIGMFGTKYGSVINDFIDITTGKRTKVPDGVAHFLEHKLFEQEGANALDLFSKIGVSSNAYTSFDHTVYFFETVEKYKESLELLIKLVRTPYFTDENVDKEQGIIGQEISMYDDEPNYKCYFNALTAMYKNNPVRIDIAGTIASISKISKETLYTCYNTFYSMQNMFFIVVGDVEVDETLDLIEQNLKLYDNCDRKDTKVKIYNEVESKEINTKNIERKMDVYMQNLCLGYKLELASGKEILKRQLISEMISEIYFSKMSKFYEEEYKKGLINDEVAFSYEGSSTFSHVIIMSETKNADKLSEDICDYIDKIKNKEVDKDVFDLVKRKKIGELLLLSDNLEVSYRRIIDKILNETEMYEDVEILKNINTNDIIDFLNMLENDNNLVISKVLSK